MRKERSHLERNGSEMVEGSRDPSPEAARQLEPFISRRRRFAAWMVHFFTALGSVLGLLTLHAIHRGRYVQAFWLMGAAIVIDSVDGVLARRAGTSVAASRINGELLDNIVDYFTYAAVPAFFLLESDLLPHGWRLIGSGLVVLSSAYQFAQMDAKTDDHFFKGFPSYWNIAVFYFFLWRLPPWANFLIVIILSILVFVPIKYVYPSRLTYLTSRRWLRGGMIIATIIWGFATFAMLWIYPDRSRSLMGISIAYVIIYTLVSIYRTVLPVTLRRTRGG